MWMWMWDIVYFKIAVCLFFGYPWNYFDHWSENDQLTYFNFLYQQYPALFETYSRSLFEIYSRSLSAHSNAPSTSGLDTLPDLDTLIASSTAGLLHPISSAYSSINAHNLNTLPAPNTLIAPGAAIPSTSSFRTSRKDISGKRFKCTQCEYVSNRRDVLDRHERRIHTNRNEKPHKCPLCDFKTSYKNSLNRHKKSQHKD